LGFGQTRLKRADELLGPFARIHHRAEYPDHIEDPCDASLIEGVDVDPAANEIGGDVRLQIGEGQNEIGTQREDFVDIRRGEGAHARLLAASLPWAHDIAGDPDDTVLLAEQIQRLKPDLPILLVTGYAKPDGLQS
jgi:hypothetical protein